jgi:CBS domain-containing protein
LGFSSVYDYVAGKQNWLASGLPTEGRDAGLPRAGTVARRDAPTCALDDRLGDVAERVRAAGWDVCVVVNEARVVLGLLQEEQLGEDPGRRVEDVMRPGPSTYRPHVDITDLADYMERHHVDRTVITTGDGVLVGVLRKEDSIQSAREVHDAHHHAEGDGG